MNAETKTAGPQIGLFHHAHGVSVGIIPPGVDAEQFFDEREGMEKGTTDEYVETFPLDEPYASAPTQAAEIQRLREALGKLVSLVSDAGDALHEAGIGYVPELNQARAALAQGGGR